jgi:hypothetical protein
MSPTPPAPKPAPPPKPPSLSSEIEALDQARTALREDQPSRALAILDDYERTMHGYRLKDEATLLRIEALRHSGRQDEARALARRFVASNPDSPLVDRALTLVDEGRPREPSAGVEAGVR